MLLLFINYTSNISPLHAVNVYNIYNFYKFNIVILLSKLPNIALLFYLSKYEERI